tara:strand:- start:52 stop:846 length:795 start_codon:yes stop_codon:yes gene_type:complete
MIRTLNARKTVYQDSFDFDPDALLYLTNSGITNNDIRLNVNTFFLDIKAAGLYDKIKAGWLHSGDTYDKQKLNIKNPIDSDSAYRLTNLNTGGISRFTDVNGTTEIQDTHFNMDNELDVSSCGATITSGGQFFSSEGSRIAFGAIQPSKRFSIIITTGSIGVFRISSQIVPTQPNGSGIFTAQSLSSLGTFFRDGVKLTSGTVTGDLPTFNCYLNALNNQGVASNVDARRLQTCLIHEALTDAETVDLHLIIDTFEASLNRKTW